jgi:hypothetical protein
MIHNDKQIYGGRLECIQKCDELRVQFSVGLKQDRYNLITHRILHRNELIKKDYRPWLEL